jgi:peroxiredoxin Q/BCP
MKRLLSPALVRRAIPWKGGVPSALRWTILPVTIYAESPVPDSKSRPKKGNPMAELAPGMKAPDFTLPRDGGGTVSLRDFRGKPVVLFFYPKDDTSGCTTEAKDFTAARPDFDAAGVALIGMSPDPVKKHDSFVKKHGLDVPLASDEGLETLQAYGVWKEKSMYGRAYMGVERTTVLIDAEGKIAEVWNKVKVPGHVAAVLDAAKKL